MGKKYPNFGYHRFLDEAGDDTFYGKKRISIIGQNGVSNTFILGMVAFKEPLVPIRKKIIELQKDIENSAYYKDVPSVKKRVNKKGGYFFHAKDDLPEIRKEFYDYIRTIDCSFQAVVGQKIISLFEQQHHGKEANFYADLLSHLLKDKFTKYPRLVLNIAERSNSTAIHNLESGLETAKMRYKKRNPKKATNTRVAFSVHKFIDEPLLAVPDYFCWAVQRVFERGETRFYQYMKDKIPLVLDLYDTKGYKGSKNYYTERNPLTQKNKVSPHTP